MEEAGLREAAARLLRMAGLPETVPALTPLAGGRNNRVWRIESDPPRVLKRYHHDPRDPRDRLGAEWAFLAYAWGDCGVRSIARPLAAEPATHSALHAFLPGARVPAVDAAHVEAARRFVAAINAPEARAAAARLAPASEACFSVTAHAETIARRVARLATQLDPEAPHAEAARAFVADALVPAWARARPAPDDTVVDWVVSPSDFGFHNALAEADGTLAFLDFEYAGRDDPAKLVCDFFCQPELPVPAQHYAAFRDAVAGSAAARARCDALLPAYRVKWCCIMLNDFLATDAARRAFATGADRAARCAAQLAKARAALPT